MQGVVMVSGVYGACTLLHAVLPTEATQGYCCDRKTGVPLKYRCNAFQCLVICVGVFVLLVRTGFVDAACFVEHYWSCFRAAFGGGVALSTVFFIYGKQIPATALDRGDCALTTATGINQRHRTRVDSTEFDARSDVEHFYCGLEFNPRVALLGSDVDVKMLLYLVGAVQLELILLSGYMSVRASSAPVSWSLWSFTVCLSWFVFEYMWFEDVHLYTYDLFRERLGFKLVWGCLCFYPFFYGIGMWPLLTTPGDAQADIGPVGALASCAIFFCGWVLTRGANLQKHAWRSARGAPSMEYDFLGLGIVRVAQTTVNNNGRLLCGGWWGLAKHVNYCGEITQAVGLALPAFLATGSLMPWLYPLYYVLLFLGRQQDDALICSKKYGADWEAYHRKVPYRIVPGLY